MATIRVARQLIRPARVPVLTDFFGAGRGTTSSTPVVLPAATTAARAARATTTDSVLRVLRNPWRCYAFTLCSFSLYTLFSRASARDRFFLPPALGKTMIAPPTPYTQHPTPYTLHPILRLPVLWVFCYLVLCMRRPTGAGRHETIRF